MLERDISEKEIAEAMTRYYEPSAAMSANIADILQKLLLSHFIYSV